MLFSLEGTLSITRLGPITQVLTGVLASGKSEEFWTWPNLDLAEMGSLLLLLPVLLDHSSPQSHGYTNDKPWKLWSLRASSELQSAAFTRAKDFIRSLLTNCATGLRYVVLLIQVILILHDGITSVRRTYLHSLPYHHYA